MRQQRDLDRPISGMRLHRDLAELGIEPGDTLTVHSSLSALGWVIGGAETVVRVLIETVGEAGTLAMPAATPQCADPADWDVPKVPDDWLDEIREHLPIFDRHTTPTRMGAIPETFRNWPGTLRSVHPLESVCAHGQAAEAVTAEHTLSFSEGRGGPWEKLYELDSRILLLGVGFNRCTALHFAESLTAQRRTTVSRYPWWRDGQRVWMEVPDMASDLDTHFPRVGDRFLASGRAEMGKVGKAGAILFSIRDLVELAVDYFEQEL